MFIPNPKFAEQMNADPDTRKGLKEAAEAAKPMIEAAARDAGAPWMPRGGELIIVGEDEDGVYIANTDHAAHLIEFGSINNPPFAPQRRGASNAGLRIEDTPKP